MINGGMFKEKQKMTYPIECPRGFEKSGKGSDIPLSDESKKYFETGEMGSFGSAKLLNQPQTFTFQKRNSLQKRNLLEPRHYNAILFPGCVNLNREYYVDSINSYRTSLDHGGKGCRDLSGNIENKSGSLQ